MSPRIGGFFMFGCPPLMGTEYIFLLFVEQQSSTERIYILMGALNNQDLIPIYQFAEVGKQTSF
jgi:hypothetical protein